jgi:hypothetical protein
MAMHVAEDVHNTVVEGRTAEALGRRIHQQLADEPDNLMVAMLRLIGATA